LAKSRTRFRVRESTQIDPDWELDKAISLWERMLASRLRTLVTRSAQEKKEGATQ
jgi:hypothetical protein